ncbi:uncharacterized protein LOC118749499 [Rhagoletis pomonella]|uniref:uncharacterized protein LOC118749499 n=1 Tax=Rhagoletis pomonella TaxID=28610 RepID=UPI0017823B5B|nr:uncharacterized protein LOC118749499 [Rhagoletis pomonella]
MMFMTADLVAVWAEIPTPRGVQEAVLASAYFPGEEEMAPTAEVKAFVEHCQQSGKPWILCCDANSNNTVWGSTDTNKREREATTAALRIPNTSDLKIGDMTGHMKVLMKFANGPILQMRDAMVPKLEISRKFEVHIADRALWNTGNPYTKPNGEVWYTDGSKLENGRTGAGIFGPNFKKMIPMGSYPTIFQAGIHAIEICGRECLRRGTSAKYICIMSDSQAALLALKSHKISSQLVHDCRNVLNALGDKNTVLLGWVPGHEGHDGNEEADCLAKQGAAAVFYGPEPFCGLTKAHIKGTINNWVDKMFNRHWMECPGQRQAKRFICPSNEVSKKLINLGREDLKTLTGYYTGHCSLRYHLSKIHLSETSVCRFCELDEETPEHILCECDALARRRLAHFGGATLNPFEIWNKTPLEVLGYIKSLPL